MADQSFYCSDLCHDTATSRPVPKTGDSSNPTLWLGPVAVGMILPGGIVLKRE